jgi:N-acetylglucosaminyl-diphospho-decaprenol L-rhamnosyltransferase
LSADPAPEAVRLAVIIVTHESSGSLPRTVPAVLAELRPGDELIVVDNASSDGSPELARELAPDATVIETGANLGYGAGNNRGAEVAKADLLCFLNPDAVPAPGFRDAIADPAAGGRDWGAWQGLVTADGGRVVNTHGGAVHFTGIAWAGGAGEPLDEAVMAEPPEPGFVSGACLAIPRKSFLCLEGFDQDFFLYHEDVDLSLRLRLSEAHLGVVTDARVDHDYEFAKGPAKWRYLERNRWATLIRTYPSALLILVLPALLLTELALVPVSIAGGWFGQKLRAWGETLRWLPRLLGERRRIHAAPGVPAREFAAGLTADLDSAYLGAAGRSRLLRAGLRAYWALVLAVLGGRRG